MWYELKIISFCVINLIGDTCGAYTIAGDERKVTALHRTNNYFPELEPAHIDDQQVARQ
jgi:hypothetical protein